VKLSYSIKTIEHRFSKWGLRTPRG